MRELTDHIVKGDSANHQLRITVLDEPGAGGACHAYQIDGFDASGNPSKPDRDEDREQGIAGPRRLTVLFQNGPINLAGVNGVTHEAFLAILIDRLRSFQKGNYACVANQEALERLEVALHLLQGRTRERIARGVEGTHEK